MLSFVKRLCRSIVSIARRAGGRGAALKRLGLDPARRTCLVFWGGIGSAKVLEAGRAILRAREPVNIIFLCGRNTQVRAGPGVGGALAAVICVPCIGGCSYRRSMFAL